MKSANHIILSWDIPFHTSDKESEILNRVTKDLCSLQLPVMGSVTFAVTTELISTVIQSDLVYMFLVRFQLRY